MARACFYRFLGRTCLRSGTVSGGEGCHFLRGTRRFEIDVGRRVAASRRWFACDDDSVYLISRSASRRSNSSWSRCTHGSAAVSGAARASVAFFNHCRASSLEPMR